MKLPGSRSVASLLAIVVLLSGVPALAADSDGDGLRDTFEKRYGMTLPNDADSDGDGVIDAAEDSDGDRLSDRAEQKLGTDPARRDSDGDGTPDGQEDADRDGRSNAVEQDHRPVPAGLRPRLRSAPKDFSPYKDGCLAKHGSSDVVTCSYGPATSGTHVVLIGDSHAMHLTTPVKTVAEENGWRLTTLVKMACPPVLGLTNRAQRALDDGTSCRQWRRNALAWLRADPPDHIILAHSDGYAIADGSGRPIPGSARPAAWRSAMERTLARMPDASKVLLLGDIPYNRFNPAQCLIKHRNNISKCVTSRQPLHKRKVERALERAAISEGARFRRFYDQVCTYDPCPIIQGTTLMYRDRGHFTATFAQQLTPTFRRMLTSIIPSTPAG